MINDVLVRAFLIISTFLYSNVFLGQSCYNMDFEQGSALGWDLNTGKVNGQVAVMTNHTAATLASSSFTIFNGGNDPMGGFPMVNPTSGNYSLRIGDYTTSGGNAASAKRTFLVDSSNANFMYSFAVVLEDPGHSQGDMPFFKVNVYDQGGVNINCGEYLVVAGNNLDATWQPYSDGWYRDWHTVFVPLAPYIGTNVTIEFISGDCDQGGHYGYAYIDAQCQGLSLIPPGTELCHNQSVTLDAPNGAISYLWNTGASSQSITTSQPGTYTVTATPVQGAVCNAVFSATIDTALGYPIADFLVDTTVCANELFQPIDSSVASPGASISFWEWDFGNNTTLDSNQSPTFSYNSTGNFLIKLVTGVISPTTGFGCYDSISKKVEVQDLSANFLMDTVCLGDFTQFNDLSQAFNASIIDWSWDYTSDGIIDNTNQNSSLIYPLDGTYDASLIVGTSFGCKDTITKQIIVKPLPSASFFSSSVCLGDTMFFNDNSSSQNGQILSWAWDFDDPSSGIQNTSNFEDPFHLYSSVGQYSVSLTVADSFGCSGNLMNLFDVYALPQADFSVQNICFNEPASFMDNSTSLGSIVSWEWDLGDGSTSFNQNPSHVYTDSLTYDVELYVTDDNGCKNNITKQVIVHPLPVMNFYSDKVNGCVPLEINFQSACANAVDWIWDFGDNGTLYQGSSGTYTYQDPGTYTITLSATSIHNCTNTLTIDDMIEAFPLPIASFNINPDQIVSIVDPNYYFLNTSWNSVQWYWDFGDGSSSTQENPSHLYIDTGWYEIEMVATSQHYCLDTVNQSVYIKPDFSLYMPNSFTPNDDLINDTYGPIGRFDGIKEYHFYIYNRWGEMVFESRDVNEKWNGRKYNDHSEPACQDGAYVWYVNVRDYLEKEYRYKGSVVLFK